MKTCKYFSSNNLGVSLEDLLLDNEKIHCLRLDIDSNIRYTVGVSMITALTLRTFVQAIRGFCAVFSQW
jgi:hypothetical protein